MLNNKQYKILKYAQKHPKYTDIFNKFNISLNNYINFNLEFKDYLDLSNNLMNETTNVKLTNLAITLIESHKKDSFRFWTNSIFAPIIVAFVTTLLTNLLLLMQPMILKWVSQLLGISF